MSEQLPIRPPAAPHPALAGFKDEASGFKLSPDSARSMTILPDSEAWHELHMSRRLEIAPFLEGLLRQGKARLVFTPEYTSTCEEKAAAAGIPVEATVKAVYCKDMYSHDDRFVVVASGKGRLSFTGLNLPGDHEFAQLETARAEDLPHGMQFGTCSPFVSDEILKGLALIVIEDPETEIKGKKGRVTGKLGDLEGDFSIGGTDSVSHHLSVRMNYRDFAETLIDRYGDKAVLSGIRRQ